MKSDFVPVEILDKRTAEGWFGRKYYVTVRFIAYEENNASPIASIKNPINELRCDINSYYTSEIGLKRSLKMYQHTDGFWRTTAQDNE